MRDFVATIIALERRQPVALPADWASLRTGWLRRLKEDPGARAEYRSCYLVLTTEEDEHAKTVPPTLSEDGLPQPAFEEEVPMPLVERVMASFQLELPTAEIERPALGSEDPDQTQMARLPEGPALPFRAGAASTPAPLPIEASPDAGETAPLIPSGEVKAQLMAIRRIHEMTVDEYAALRASLALVLETEGAGGAQRVWAEARLPLAEDQERLRQRFFRLFQKSPAEREAFESALRAHLRKLRAEA